MTVVVGGTYIERCLEPPWNSLYGSGLRAAAVLASNADDTRLVTCIGRPERSELNSACESYGIQVSVTEIEATIEFSYVHCLSVPIIRPFGCPIATVEPIVADAVLQYGMLEASPTVNADTVVYDPQSPVVPRRFSGGGSAAKRLAVIANAVEVRLMTGEADLEAAACALARMEHAAVVVVKRGSSGALVFADGSTTHIPAYRPASVFSIGSGDVFSAAFFRFWAVDGKNVAEAADLASRAVARYLETRDPNGLLDERILATYQPVAPRTCTVYLASPFFNLAQRWLANEARTHLTEQGHIVKSPLHDVGHGEAQDVAPKDLAMLEECNMVFAIADGADPGTMFEVGYARKKGIGVVVFSQSLSGEGLKMVVGSGCILESDFVTALFRVAWAA